MTLSWFLILFCSNLASTIKRFIKLKMHVCLFFRRPVVLAIFHLFEQKAVFVSLAFLRKQNKDIAKKELKIIQLDIFSVFFG